MKTIDLENWSRRKHFALFRTYKQPFFNICLELDISTFLAQNQTTGRPFFLSFLHAVMQAVNRTEALRLRIHGETVVLHETVHASFTMMTEAHVFRFVTVRYQDDFAGFMADATAAMAVAKHDISVTDEPGVDDLVFISSVPWITFTAVEHAMPGVADDSFPRITWGKYHEASGKTVIPLSVAVHHALADGQDIGAFVQTLQSLLDGGKS
ncbi:MAG: CatA-like O-acetyltransferase [bacterium]